MAATAQALKRGGRSSEPIKKEFYNANASKLKKEAESEKEDFKRGGKAKRKHGGKADGKRAHRRADKPHRARGGHTPFTEAATVKGRPGAKYDGAPSTKQDD
jgi:hypothetical protein